MMLADPVFSHLTVVSVLKIQISYPQFAHSPQQYLSAPDGFTHFV